MLVNYDEQTSEAEPDKVVVDLGAIDLNKAKQHSGQPTSDRLSRVLRLEWLGQTVASLCWIASVLAYGISSTGDWLQLSAASAWLLANIATVVSVEAD